MLANEGLKSFWFRALSETAYRRMLVMERRADDPGGMDARIPVAFRPLAPAEAAAYVAFRPETQPADVTARFARGETCFAAFVDDVVVAACWIAAERARIEYLECEIDVDADSRYVYDLYAAPQVRGQDVYRAGYAAIVRHLHATGGRRLLVAAHVENRTHLLFARLGFRPIGVIRSLRLGPWRYAFARYRDRRPELAPPRRLQRRTRTRAIS